jgi:cytochrome c553
MGAGLLLALLGLTCTVAYADAMAGEKKAQLCLLCHKPNNPMAYLPTLEGQTREYLYIQLKAYQEGRRPDPYMQTNVATLSETDLRDIADYFASRQPVRASFPLDSERIAQGRAKAGALACASCHRSDFSGAREVPRLAGLDPRYLGIQILHFTQGRRPHPGVDGLRELSREDAESLAHFFAHLE